MKLTIKRRFVFIVNLNIEMSFFITYLLIVNLKTVYLSDCFSVVNFI